jgi:putative membrane protein
MSEFKRQHPVAAISRAVDLIRGNIITIIIVLVFGASGGGGPSFLWVFIGLFIFLLVAGTAGWWRFVYRVEDGELQIKQGIIVRKNLYLTKDRIQVIDITAGIIQRMFGLVKVEIKTAGSSSREASLSAVTKSEAKYLTQLLRGNGEEVDEGEEPKPDDEEKYFLPGKELLIAASTSGSFGIALSILATVFSQIEPLISETEMYEWLIQYIPSDTDVLFVITIILVFVIFAWLMSFFGTLIRYGDFTLAIKKDEMVISRGIFEKKRITVPFNRIQAVRVVEGIMRQPLGYATIYVESAGYGDQQGSGSVVLMPLIKKSEIQPLIQKILPEYGFLEDLITPPKRAVTRYIIRSSVVLGMIIFGIYWFLEAPAMIWIFMIPGFFWGWLRHRDAAAGIDRERIMIRSRVLSLSTAVVRRKRAQDMSSIASWIQRYRKLANLEVSVASGDQGRSFSVQELDEQDAERLLPWISKLTQNSRQTLSSGPRQSHRAH